MNTVLYFLGYENTISDHAKKNPGLASMAIFVFVLFFFYGVAYCYGAAKLSYNYNISIGNVWTAVQWAILCYFFAGLYYPYYAIFLNPISATVSMTGGRKRIVK